MGLRRGFRVKRHIVLDRKLLPREEPDCEEVYQNQNWNILQITNPFWDSEGSEVDSSRNGAWAPLKPLQVDCLDSIFLQALVPSGNNRYKFQKSLGDYRLRSPVLAGVSSMYLKEDMFHPPTSKATRPRVRP